MAIFMSLAHEGSPYLVIARFHFNFSKNKKPQTTSCRSSTPVTHGIK